LVFEVLFRVFPSIVEDAHVFEPDVLVAPILFEGRHALDV